MVPFARPFSDNVMSGKYGGSSNPTQGYIGNMMQLHNYALNVSVNRTYFWQIQTIDNGLKAGNWSSLQSYDPCPYSSGNWNITVECVRYNENITVNGNITVDNGKLVLINSTLIFNSSSSLRVINGVLNITNSNISSINANSFDINIHSSSALQMENSYLSNSNGIELNSSDVVFRDNVLTDNVYGITLANDNILLANSTISSTSYDIINDGSSNVLLNVSFSSLSVISGYVTLERYLIANVTDNNVPASGVSITAYDMNNDSYVDLITKGFTGSQYELVIYYWNGSDFNKSIISDTDGYYGTLTIIDYDKDNDLDLVSYGKNPNEIFSRLFKKE